MDANDVYNVAKALPKDEYYKLYNLIVRDFNIVPSKKKKGLPEFTLEDAIRYILENHC